jgi:HSP20 family molecular chaperone IbpA
MKRMYVILLIIVLGFIGMVYAIGQTQSQTKPQSPTRQPFDRIKRRAELREEMHRRIREMLINGKGDQQNLFKDLEQEFEDTMTDSFSGFDQGVVESNFKSEWTQNTHGRTLVITPKDPSQKINIDVNAALITIKGESQKQTATSTISSAFINSFPVPDDCDGTKVKMNSRDGKILVELPFKSVPALTNPSKKVEKKPLTPNTPDDIDI